MSENQESDSKEKKETKEPKRDIDSNPHMFEDGDSLVIKPESNLDLNIPTTDRTYTEYKASEETWQMAFQEKKRNYLKGIAKYHKFTVFLDSTPEEVYAKNPLADPKYDKEIILEFNAKISDRQYNHFTELRSKVQDMERTSFGTLVDYKEMGVRPPDKFSTVRQDRRMLEKQLYDAGLRIFFKMRKSSSANPENIPEGMLERMEMRSTRDLIDAMDIRLNLGIQDSVSDSTNISSTKRNMSSSIA